MSSQLTESKETSSKTKVEDFLKTQGRIIVKIVHDISTLNASYGATIDLTTVRIFRPLHVDESSDGIRVEIKKDEDSDSSESAFLDLDEVDDLVDGLRYMAKIAAQSHGYKGDYTEVVFSTKGDLKVGFYVSSGKVNGFLTISYSTIHLDIKLLTSMAQLFESGKTYLKDTPIVYASSESA